MSAPRRAGTVALAALFLFAFVGFVALGAWQLQRRTWKLDLIERVDQRVHAQPVAAPPPERWRTMNPADDEYRRVRLAGTFLHDRETLVQAVTELGGGYWVMTPLRTLGGNIVLVNRGFVLPDRRDRSKRAGREPSGEVTVTGLVRFSEPAGGLMGLLRRNDPTAERWYRRDVAAIVSARRLPDGAPWFLDADPIPDTEPVGGLTVISFSNNHLVYALTWFALALIAAFGAFRLLRSDGATRIST